METWEDSVYAVEKMLYNIQHLPIESLIQEELDATDRIIKQLEIGAIGNTARTNLLIRIANVWLNIQARMLN